MNEKQFAAAIKRAVQKSGDTRTEVAELAGVAESTIRAIESGKCPSVVRADRILRAMGLRLLLGDPAGETLEMD